MGRQVAHIGRVEVNIGFWWGNLRERNHFEDLVLDGRIILKCIYKDWDRSWTELIWLIIYSYTGGGLL